MYGVGEEDGVCWRNNMRQLFYTIYDYGKKENISMSGSHERGGNGTEVC